MQAHNPYLCNSPIVECQILQTQSSCTNLGVQDLHTRDFYNDCFSGTIWWHTMGGIGGKKYTQ